MSLLKIEQLRLHDVTNLSFANIYMHMFSPTFWRLVYFFLHRLCDQWASQGLWSGDLVCMVWRCLKQGQFVHETLGRLTAARAIVTLFGMKTIRVGV